jgi:hypothetical protein
MTSNTLNLPRYCVVMPDAMAMLLRNVHSLASGDWKYNKQIAPTLSPI